MTLPEYSTAGGGALKFKGVSGVIKKKKKKKEHAVSANRQAKPDTLDTTNPPSLGSTEVIQEHSQKQRSGSRSPLQLSREEEKEVGQLKGKTPAERQYEEARRRRLEERLKREGAKTHKERVEELNRYLSNLSEHHDMYVFLYSRQNQFPLLIFGMIGHELDLVNVAVYSTCLYQLGTG